MGPEVSEEGRDSLRDVAPELGMHPELSGVGVKAAMRCVKNARPEVRQLHLGHAAQALANRRLRITHRGAVLLRRRAQDGGAFLGVETGLPHIAQYLAYWPRRAACLRRRQA